MPKRSCPFEGDLLPQMKIHVEEKHVNNGVSSKERMKDVYDKTLNLLKAGAKTYVNGLNKSPTDSTHLVTSGPPSYKLKSSSSLKQMLLTDRLQLKTSDKVINDVRLDLCGCCQLIDKSIFLHKCCYCDQVLCSSCMSTCAGCSELFCQNCCLPVYNYEDQTMCHNCYR